MLGVKIKNSVVSFAAVVVLLMFLASCVSLEGRQMTWQEKSEANIAGTVSVEFTPLNVVQTAT